MHRVNSSNRQIKHVMDTHIGYAQHTGIYDANSVE
jgi:hypothetical protein